MQEICREILLLVDETRPNFGTVWFRKPASIYSASAGPVKQSKGEWERAHTEALVGDRGGVGDGVCPNGLRRL